MLVTKTVKRLGAEIVYMLCKSLICPRRDCRISDPLKELIYLHGGKKQSKSIEVWIQSSQKLDGQYPELMTNPELDVWSS